MRIRKSAEFRLTELNNPNPPMGMPVDVHTNGPLCRETIAILVYSKRVVLAVCTGRIGSEMMALCRKQRVLVGCRYGLHVGDGVLMSGG
jgi:hypothetical protein